jgi:hypothetical protein
MRHVEWAEAERVRLSTRQALADSQPIRRLGAARPLLDENARLVSRCDGFLICRVRRNQSFNVQADVPG